MPITPSARKKMRADKFRRNVNLREKRKYKTAVKLTRQQPTQQNLQTAYSRLDIAAKKNVIHKNKAARLKSRLSRKVKKV